MGLLTSIRDRFRKPSTSRRARSSLAHAADAVTEGVGELASKALEVAGEATETVREAAGDVVARASGARGGDGDAAPDDDEDRTGSQDESAGP